MKWTLSVTSDQSVGLRWSALYLLTNRISPEKKNEGSTFWRAENLFIHNTSLLSPLDTASLQGQFTASLCTTPTMGTKFKT